MYVKIKHRIDFVYLNDLKYLRKTWKRFKQSLYNYKRASKFFRSLFKIPVTFVFVASIRIPWKSRELTILCCLSVKHLYKYIDFLTDFWCFYQLLHLPIYLLLFTIGWIINGQPMLLHKYVTEASVTPVMIFVIHLRLSANLSIVVKSFVVII